MFLEKIMSLLCLEPFVTSLLLGWSSNSLTWPHLTLLLLPELHLLPCFSAHCYDPKQLTFFQCFECTLSPSPPGIALSSVLPALSTGCSVWELVVYTWALSEPNTFRPAALRKGQACCRCWMDTRGEWITKERSKRTEWHKPKSFTFAFRRPCLPAREVNRSTLLFSSPREGGNTVTRLRSYGADIVGCPGQQGASFIYSFVHWSKCARHCTRCILIRSVMPKSLWCHGL